VNRHLTLLLSFMKKLRYIGNTSKSLEKVEDLDIIEQRQGGVYER